MAATAARKAAPAPAPAPKPAPAAASKGAPGTAQAGGAAVRLAGDSGAEIAPGVLDLKAMGDKFQPSAPIAAFLDAHKRSRVQARLGAMAQGLVEVETQRPGHYRLRRQRLPLQMPLLARVSQAMPGLTPMLQLDTEGLSLHGRVAFLSGERGEAVETLLRKAPDLLGLAGFSLPGLGTLVNKLEGGRLKFGLSGATITLGNAFDGKLSLLADDESVGFEAQASVSARGAVNGTMEMQRNAEGLVTGKATLALQMPKNFSGNFVVTWDGNAISGESKVGYSGEKLSGSITLRLMEREAALALEKEKKAPSAETPAAPAAATAAKKASGKKVDYVLFGEGDLDFSFNAWLHGNAHVIVDPKGYVTIIGKITPQAEFELFPQKDYVKQLFKLEVRATYGLPVVGNLFIFGNVGMDAFAKIGPGRFYKIIAEGTYSTDPEKCKSFSIQGSLNISAAAGMRLRAEAGLGIEILSHDIKAGVGLNGIAGVKGYVEATPIIGYREAAANGQDKKGEWFLRGELEMAAQPFLGLSGDLFIELDTPWWSPLSDDKWTWPLFGKEWPLGGSLGVMASMDYVFGSGEWPKLELKPAEFSGDKFLTELYEDKAKPGKGGEVSKPGAWKEKNSPAAAVPPKKPPAGNAKPGKAASLPAPKSKGKGGGKGKKDKPVDPEAKTAGGKKVKQLQDEAVKKGKKPPGGKDSKGADKAAAGDKSKDKAAGGDAAKQALAALDQVTQRYAEKGASKEEMEAAVKATRRKFKVFKSLKVQEDGDHWNYDYEMSPGTTKKGPKKTKTPKVKSHVLIKPEGGRSKYVLAAPLTEKAGNTTGSAPVSKPDSPLGWPRVKSFDPDNKYWVRMHLLNDNLHGPGTWNNVAPGDKGANSTMERDYESKAKTRVEQGEILWYEVTANYRAAPDQDFPESFTLSMGTWEPDAAAPDDPAKGKRGKAIFQNKKQPIDPPGKAGVAPVPVINSNDGYRQFAGLKGGITEDLAVWLTQERSKKAFDGRKDLWDRIKATGEAKYIDRIEALRQHLDAGTLKISP